MRLSRRTLLGTIAATSATLAMPAIVRAQSEESFWDNLTRGKMMRDTDKDGNTATAKGLVDTIEPILSYDTAYNLQLAIQNHEAFIAAGGGWAAPSRETFGLILGKGGRAVTDLKRRLMTNGDMTFEKRVSSDFDDKLDAAVRVFQARH